MEGGINDQHPVFSIHILGVEEEIAEMGSGTGIVLVRL